MATRGAKRSALGSKGSSSERRTTLRVPRSLETEISRVAHELGVSENQALMHLAALGAENARREREVRRVVERRRTAVMGAGVTGATFPSAQEMREAILVDRD